MHLATGAGWHSGCGFEGDGVSEGFELADVAASLAVCVDVPVVVIDAEVVKPGVGLSEEMPDDHQHGAASRDDRFVLAASAGEASVAGAKERLGATSSGGGLAEG